MNIGDKFLLQCKENYFGGITPACNECKEDYGYQNIVSIFKNYIKDKGIESFALFFQESQYLVNLWAAHLILEQANVSQNLQEEAISIILSYSATPLDEKLANEEKGWLKERRLVE